MGDLRFNRFVPDEGWFHVASTQFSPGGEVAVHGQDFPEVFWLDSGRGVHRVNGRTVRLTAGDLVVMRRSDRHGFAIQRGRSFSLVNVAFRQKSLDAIRRRYYPDGDWPWAGDALPAQFHIGPAGIAHLARVADELARATQSRLMLDSFLLDALKLTTHAGPAAGDDRPAWLRDAVQRLDHDGDLLRGGAAALALATARSPEHLNRVVRRCHDQTTTELINRARLDRAAQLLRMTALPITEVAYESGYENLGYFYRRFAERFDTTPRKYRLAARAVVRQ